MKTPKILIADDDEFIRSVTKKCFELKGFNVIAVANGKEAISEEETTRPDVIILDVEMPVLNGFEACRIIREKRKGNDYVPIIFASGNSTEELVTKGLEAGADDYVHKPFEFFELFNRVNNSLRMRKFIEYLGLAENVIFSLVKSVDARDFYTAGHSHRVAGIATNIGKELGFSKDKVEILYKASLLHDIGKIEISDQILNKQGKLSEHEFNYIKEHPFRGEIICKCLRLDQLVFDIIRHHHEKLDGTGYPDGVKNEKIGELVRVVTVADMFDALTTTRPYRAIKSHKEAILMLKQEVDGGKLEEFVVKCLEKICCNN